MEAMEELLHMEIYATDHVVKQHHNSSWIGQYVCDRLVWDMTNNNKNCGPGALACRHHGPFDCLVSRWVYTDWCR